MKVAILSARTGWHTDELCRALTERGHVGQVLPYESLVARLGTAPGVDSGLRASGAPQNRSNEEGTLKQRATADRAELLDSDAVLARIIPNGSLDQIIYRVDALHWIEERGVPVVNSPRTIERCVDKFYTSALLQEAGLATPETVVCERLDDAMAAVRAMGDVVIKPLFGSMGHGMVRVSDPDTAFRVLRALEALRAVVYIQRVVHCNGRDVRAFVVGERVIGAIERSAPEGDWRTNVSRGGAAVRVKLSETSEQLALRAARAVGADYAGIDLLPDADGTVYVLEVNGIPGWRGLQQTTPVDVAGAIADHVIDRVENTCPGKRSN